MEWIYDFLTTESSLYFLVKQVGILTIIDMDFSPLSVESVEISVNRFV